MFKFIIKPIPTKFVVLNEKEVRAYEVMSLLEQFSEDDEINN